MLASSHPSIYDVLYLLILGSIIMLLKLEILFKEESLHTLCVEK